MANDILQALHDLKGRWTMGGSAVEKAPPEWRTTIQDDPNPDLALLALAGQARQFVFRAIPGGQLSPVPTLPSLSLPTPPPHVRQLIRHFVQIQKWPTSQLSALIELLAGRGYVIHPADYMPLGFDSLPAVYAPWACWQQAKELDDASTKAGMISADNWEHWMPAERRSALILLRSQDAAAARDLIASQLPSLAAEERLRILESLGETLCKEDQALLERFSKDRSGKVRQLIAQYLARIGAVADDATTIEEFVSFFTVAKRTLRGGYRITANRLKTKAQRKRRSDLAGALSLQGFVQGLQLANAEELIAGWDHVDEDASDCLVRIVAATGNEKAAAALAAKITTLDGISAESFQLLFARLGKDGRRELLPSVLNNDDATFAASVFCAQGLWGELSLERLRSLRALKELKKLAGEDLTRSPVRQETLRQGLFSLGLLADQHAASELMQLFTEGRLYASDPMLGLLKLNASLPRGERL